MASHYSQLLATAADQNTLVNNIKSPAGLAGGRMRYKAMRILTDQVFAITEVIRMGTFKSNDRIYELRLTCPDLGTAGDFDIGLYAVGANHDGAVVDDNLFADALDVNTTVSNRVDCFGAGTTPGIANTDRGQALWVLLGLSADPVVEYDLTITAVEATTSVSATVLLEAFYNSGD